MPGLRGAPRHGGLQFHAPTRGICSLVPPRGRRHPLRCRGGGEGGSLPVTDAAHLRSHCSTLPPPPPLPTSRTAPARPTPRAATPPRPAHSAGSANGDPARPPVGPAPAPQWPMAAPSPPAGRGGGAGQGGPCGPPRPLGSDSGGRGAFTSARRCCGEEPFVPVETPPASHSPRPRRTPPRPRRYASRRWPLAVPPYAAAAGGEPLSLWSPLAHSLLSPNPLRPLPAPTAARPMVRSARAVPSGQCRGARRRCAGRGGGWPHAGPLPRLGGAGSRRLASGLSCCFALYGIKFYVAILGFLVFFFLIAPHRVVCVEGWIKECYRRTAAWKVPLCAGVASSGKSPDTPGVFFQQLPQKKDGQLKAACVFSVNSADLHIGRACSCPSTCKPAAKQGQNAENFRAPGGSAKH